jgi:hypothetical protein
MWDFLYFLFDRFVNFHQMPLGGSSLFAFVFSQLWTLGVIFLKLNQISLKINTCNVAGNLLRAIAFGR